MMKELNLKIEKCEDCPYFKTLYTYGPDGHTRDDMFVCNKQAGYNQLRIDPDVYKQHNFLHKDCPLKDCREQGVKVGVSVFVFNENKEILIGHRTPDDLWGLPGGGMIAGETPKETAKRETEEETGVVVDPQKIYFATFTNDVFLKEKNEHWITLYYICDCKDWTGTPERKESTECLEWKWSNLDNLPQNLFCDWGKFIPELKEIVNISRRSVF